MFCFNIGLFASFFLYLSKIGLKEKKKPGTNKSKSIRLASINKDKIMQTSPGQRGMERCYGGHG